MSNMRGFDAAQREYDNRTPPDDGPSECHECSGRGAYNDEDGEACKTCCGSGYINDDGSPFDPNAAEYAADQYADMQRDERDKA